MHVAVLDVLSKDCFEVTPSGDGWMPWRFRMARASEAAMGMLIVATSPWMPR